MEFPAGTSDLSATRFADNRTGDDDKTQITDAGKLAKGTVFGGLHAGNGYSRGRSWAFGALALAAAVGIGFGIYKFTPLFKPAAKQTAAAPRMILTQLTSAGNVGQTTISPDGRYAAYSVTDRSKNSIRLRQTATTSDVEIVAPSEAELGGMNFTPDGDYLYYLSNESIYKIPTLGGPPQKISSKVGDGVTVSPNGKSIGFYRLDNKVWSLILADADGSNERIPFTPKEPDTIFPIKGPAWSADGIKLVCPLNTIIEAGKRETKLFAIKIADGSREQIGDSKWVYISHIKWLPNGNVVVSGSLDTTVKADSDNILWLISPNSPPQKLTNDLNMYVGVSATLKGDVLISSRVINKFNILVAPNNDASRAVELSASSILSSLAWTLDGKLIYTEVDKDVWMMNADGTNLKQLTSGQRASYVAPMVADGRYIVFSSTLADGSAQVWRMNADGGNPTQLTTGESHGHPEISLDGKWVIYDEYRNDKVKSLWKIPIEGGTPEQLTTFPGQSPSVSPVDGTVGFIFEDATNSTYNIGFTTLGGTEPIKTRPLKKRLIQFQWTPDGKGIAYLDTKGDMTNVWSEPAEGKGTPQMLSDFHIQKLRGFAWSTDGKQLAIIRRTRISDAVLLSETK